MNVNPAPPKWPHVFVGLIARHVVTTATHVTLSRLKVEANNLGIRVSEETEEAGGIALARALLVERFFDHTDAGWFLSFDDDVGRFRGADLARMLAHDVDVVGAPLPGRAIMPSMLQRAITAREPLDSFLNIHENLSPLLVRWLPEGPRWIRSPAGPLCEVEGTSAGCLLISRKAIAKLIEHGHRFDFNGRKPPLGVFDFTALVPDDSYFFCKTWRSLGGKVYVDGKTTLSHRGVVDFTTKSLVAIEGVSEVLVPTGGA